MTLPWPSVSPPDSAPGYGGRSQNESTPTAKAACGSAARGVGVLSELGLPVRSLKSFRIDSGFSETVPKGPLKWQLAHNSNEWSRSPGPLLWLQRSPLRAEHQSVAGAAAIALGGLDQLIDLVLCQVFAGARLRVGCALRRHCSNFSVWRAIPSAASVGA